MTEGPWPTWVDVRSVPNYRRTVVKTGQLTIRPAVRLVYATDMQLLGLFGELTEADPGRRDAPAALGTSLATREDAVRWLTKSSYAPAPLRDITLTRWAGSSQAAHYYWVSPFLALNDAGDVVGGVRLSKCYREPVFDVGTYLFDKYRRMGYGESIVAAVSAFTFVHTGFSRLDACHYVGNEGSARVLRACGFDGPLQHQERTHDDPARPRLLWTLSSERWLTSPVRRHFTVEFTCASALYYGDARTFVSRQSAHIASAPVLNQ